MKQPDIIFGYDLVDGKFVINEEEADLVKFNAAVYIGEKPTPPARFVEAIVKHHNGTITTAEAEKLAFEEHYRNMYYNALCRKKYIAIHGHEPPSPTHFVGKMK